MGSRNEAGALNEAFSDILATSVEFFYQEPGVGLLKADYLIAEDVADPLVAGLNRSLEDPQRFGDPDHNSNYSFDRADNGTSGMTVQGVGREQQIQMAEVFYRAFTELLPSSATFHLARLATIQAARDLDPSGGLASAVTQAWNAVGVD